jgi:hypothetical protein
MRRDEAPDRNRVFHEQGHDDESVSRRRAMPDLYETERGSHVTPVAPPAEPTDPFSTRGPLSKPPSWLPLDDGEPTISESQNPGPPPSREVLEFYAQIEGPRPRDTLPSPPPGPEDTDSVPPPTIVDHLGD